MSNISNFSVFEKCFSLLSLKNFRCPYHDTYAKKLLSGAAILLFVDAHLRQLGSLEEIADNLEANQELQDYLKLESISASALNRKLLNLPSYLLRELAQRISYELSNYHASSNQESNLGVLSIIDSTEISLPKKAGEWAYCSSDKNAVKIHMKYQWVHEDIQYAKNFITSTAAVSDKEATIYLVTDKNTTYVFDRGYINYSLYRDWVQNDIQFVARIKANSKTKILEDYPIQANSNVSRDAKVELMIPKEEDTFVLRLVEYKDTQNRTYRVLTNRWDLSAEEVAEIYRKRWAIEIFFKWIKQHLQTIKWFSFKERAVWDQVYLAYIAYGLCELITREIAKNKPRKTTRWEVLKKLRIYWYKEWNSLVDKLIGETKKSSKGRRKKGKPGRPRKHPKKYKAVKQLDPNITIIS